MKKPLKKRHRKVISFFLTIALVLSFSQLFVLTASAAPANPEPNYGSEPKLPKFPGPELANAAAVTSLKNAIATGTETEIELPGRSVIIIGDPGEGKNGLDITRSVMIDLCGRTLQITTTSYDTNGINIAPGKMLTIKDSAGGGKLIVNVSNGSGINTTSAAVAIFSGTVTATGGEGGAGIGGGRWDDGGIVYIYGGTVTATGGSGGAGIGGGHGDDGTGDDGGSGGKNDGYSGNGGIVYIYGGTVTATGGSGGAGIGGGYSGVGGTVTISGGIVTATGGSGGAGIGGGGHSDGGTVKISGGIVAANGGSGGAGIGGGGGWPEYDYIYDYTQPGTLTITGGNIIPISGNHADPRSDAITVATNGALSVSKAKIYVANTNGEKLEGVNISVGSYKASTNDGGLAVIWINSPSFKAVTLSKSGYITKTATINFLPTTGAGIGVYVTMVPAPMFEQVFVPRVGG